MIRALAAAVNGPWTGSATSRQKKDAVFELAARIAVIAERVRGSEGKAVAEAARVERRRALRLGLELISEGADAEALERAFAVQPAFKESDPGTALELRVTRAGLKGILAGEHPYTLMQRMTARLGPEYFDKAEAWILARLKRRRYRAEALVVPGELPDVVRSLALDSRSLERALRAAGRDIVAASLAGCPQESLDLAKPLFGKIGGAALEDDAAYLRSRLSGDEIEQAQAAFLEIVRNLEERGELSLGDESELSTDPSFVDELTRAVLALDERLLKAAVRSAEGSLLAVAMQAMEPSAHERILGTLTKKDERRILDAIDDTNPLPRRVIHEAGKELASALLAAAMKAGSAPREALERLTRVRDWEG